MTGNQKSFQSEIRDYIVNHDGYDATSKFLNIDNLWIKPDVNEGFCDLVCGYIAETYDVNQISAIITADTLSYPYGPVPIATLLSAKLKKPLGIVKEGNDPISGRHAYFGVKEPKNALFFYDVTRFGISAKRLLFHLFDEGINPKWFLTIVDFREGAFDFIKNSIEEKGSPKVEVNSIVSIDDL